jgi:hypothetical protein
LADIIRCSLTKAAYFQGGLFCVCSRGFPRAILNGLMPINHLCDPRGYSGIESDSIGRPPALSKGKRHVDWLCCCGKRDLRRGTATRRLDQHWALSNGHDSTRLPNKCPPNFLIVGSGAEEKQRSRLRLNINSIMHRNKAKGDSNL